MTGSRGSFRRLQSKKEMHSSSAEVSVRSPSPHGCARCKDVRRALSVAWIIRNRRKYLIHRYKHPVRCENRFGSVEARLQGGGGVGFSVRFVLFWRGESLPLPVCTLPHLRHLTAPWAHKRSFLRSNRLFLGVRRGRASSGHLLFLLVRPLSFAPTSPFSLLPPSCFWIVFTITCFILVIRGLHEVECKHLEIILGMLSRAHLFYLISHLVQ